MFEFQVLVALMQLNDRHIRCRVRIEQCCMTGRCSVSPTVTGCCHLFLTVIITVAYRQLKVENGANDAFLPIANRILSNKLQILFISSLTVDFLILCSYSFESNSDFRTKSILGSTGRVTVVVTMQQCECH